MLHVSISLRGRNSLRNTDYHSQRAGFSLLEVLIAMFVMAIGLLGLAALLPVGGKLLERSRIADHKAFLGRQVLREVRMQRLLAPPTPNSPGHWQGLEFHPRLIDGDGFVIDPLLIARNSQNLQAATRFPFGVTGPLFLPRVTMDWLWTDDSKNSSLKLSSAEHNLVRIKLAEQLCMSPDDLVIERPDDEELPARQLSSTGGERPFDGAFSWMVTAVREPQSVEEHNTQQAIARDLFTVSAVVFYRRKLSASTVQERRVLVDSIGAGLSGSEVELSFTSEEGIRPGQWIMLWANIPQLPGQGLLENRGYFRWYQVITASQDEDQLGKWFLSLRGPDWTDVLQRASLNNNIATFAIIVDSVVGVYEEVMQVETPSAWNGWQP